MISKELLSIVMCDKIERFRILNNVAYIYYLNDEQEYFISVYELAYRCREWAMTKGYQVSACRPIVQDDTGAQVINYWYKSYIFKFEIGSYEPPEQILKFDVNVKSEPAAIFRACEYILEQNEENEC